MSASNQLLRASGARSAVDGQGGSRARQPISFSAPSRYSLVGIQRRMRGLQVDKILGPGNQYVTAAKMLLQNSEAMIAMDMPAGPSEVLVIADSEARPAFIAADLLSQAEHGPDSQVRSARGTRHRSKGRL